MQASLLFASFGKNLHAMDPMMLAALSVFACVGFLALCSPNSFSAISTSSNKWIDTDKLLAVLDKQFDIDQYVLPYSRALGFAVLAAVGVFAYLYVKHLGG